LIADLAGLALLVGILWAGFRRYVLKPDRLDNRWDDAFVLALLFLAVVTGFLLEGIRIHYTEDQWALWSPIGYLVSLGVGGMSDGIATRVVQATWWFHFVILFVFIASFPYTKFFHVFTMPFNVFFSSLEPKGSLQRVDIEEMMNENKHPLSPKQLINDLKEFSWKEYNSAGSAKGNGDGKENPSEEAASAPAPIVGNAFETDTIWECRTCRACMEVCPAHIEHVPQIMELRRAEVMMRGQLPQDAAIALKQMEKTGNPFGPQDARSEWIRDTGIPVIGPGEECEMLFWIGCCTTYDPIKQKVAYNVVKILQAAGIEVAVLGDDEHCCGDPARLMGDENLLQATVKSQIESIQSRKFKYLISHCPHCLNNFRNEYPQFGARFKTIHHTEAIYQLIKDGRLKLEVPIERKITYHDPCYLGRYNNIYEEPREIIRSIKGVQLVEMKNNREKARCCGGGGGHYWMDLEHGERINVARVEEALETEADVIAVSCIYCLQMLDDAVKILNLDEKMKVKDISELVVEAMGGQAEILRKDIREVLAA
jgi:Fe-S oxidoreductase